MADGSERQAEMREIQQAVRAAKDAEPIHVQIDPLYALFLISMVQLARRHPGTRDTVPAISAEEMARQLQARLPEPMRRVADRGWHREFDEPAREFAERSVLTGWLEDVCRPALLDDERMKQVGAMVEVGLDQGDPAEEILRRAIGWFVKDLIEGETE